MFPGDSDPWLWGTDGINPGDDIKDHWTEYEMPNNPPDDRRFMQSAGPFTLKPGALNYITVGIPWAQAASGDQWSSVELLRQVDDVCQALFENCFKVLDGPDAPTLTAQELNNEIILYISYENPESNNYGEKYNEEDPAIMRSYSEVTSTDTVIGGVTYTTTTTTAYSNSISAPTSLKVIRYTSLLTPTLLLPIFATIAKHVRLLSVTSRTTTTALATETRPYRN